ncbi:unnamed protein product [Prunus armeniaca]
MPWSSPCVSRRTLLMGNCVFILPPLGNEEELGYFRQKAWRPPFKKFLAHPASPLGRFLRAASPEGRFGRRPASPLGRCLWTTACLSCLP